MLRVAARAHTYSTPMFPTSSMIHPPYGYIPQIVAPVSVRFEHVRHWSGKRQASQTKRSHARKAARKAKRRAKR